MLFTVPKNILDEIFLKTFEQSLVDSVLLNDYYSYFNNIIME